MQARLVQNIPAEKATRIGCHNVFATKNFAKQDQIQRVQLRDSLIAIVASQSHSLIRINLDADTLDGPPWRHGDVCSSINKRLNA